MTKLRHAFLAYEIIKRCSRREMISEGKLCFVWRVSYLSCGGSVFV